MNQLTIYVLIFVLLGLYVPLVQLYSAQKKEMSHRRLRPDKRSFAAKQKELFTTMSVGQKIFISSAILAAIAAILIYLAKDTWEKLL